MTGAELLAALTELRAQVAKIGDEEAAALAELRAIKDPRWTVSSPHALPDAVAGVAYSHDLSQYVTATDPVTYSRTGGTAPTSIRVSAAGSLTVTRTTAAGNYSVEVDAT